MAKHILEGKPMVYYYGQGYMGSLEAFVGALVFLLRGMDIFSVQLAPLVFFILFLIVNFYLLKRTFGLEVSVMANLLLAVSTPALTALSVTALGGYPETLFFGSLTLLGTTLLGTVPKMGTVPIFLTGVAAGIGFWTNNLILIYFLAMGVFGLLRSKFWRKTAASYRWHQIFLLQNMGIPPFFRWIGVVIHLGVLSYILWNAFSFFTGDTITMGGMKLEMASPPFHVKKVKKIILLLTGEIIALCLLTQGMKKVWKKILPALPLAGGFLLGACPVFLYSLLGGEGYRVIHGSGIVLAKDFPLHFRTVMVNGFLDGVLGVSLQNWPVLILCLGLLFCFAFYQRKELGALLGLRPLNYSFALFPVLLSLINLAICSFNNLQSARYLTPLYFSLSLIFALTLSKMKRKIGAVSWLLLLFLVSSQGYANFASIQQMPKRDHLKKAHESVLSFLEARGVRGAYAHYVTSYVLTFQSREEIIVAPYRSHDRYPAYTEYVDRLDRAAYILQESIQSPESFQRALDQNKISYEKVWMDPFWIYVIDRTVKSEKGIV